MDITCKDVMDVMEQWAPLKFAEDWDNPGFLVGDPRKEVKKVLVALDAIDPVIDEAIALGCDIIVTHHPILFGAIKKVTTQTPLGAKIYKMIQNNISHYAAHTNLDSAWGGTNDVLARLAGLEEIRVIDETNQEKLYKIVVYSPKSHEEAVRDALCTAGAGQIGENYSHCTFSSEGTGTFLPQPGAAPFIGAIGNLEKVQEIRLETIVPQDKIAKAVSSMLKAHPYEEPAYDIYPVEQTGASCGIGRIGKLKEETTFIEFARMLKEKLGLASMRIVGDPNKKVKVVGLGTGSAIEYMKKAKSMGADVYITGDLRYHESQKAIDAGVCLIDATHYASENIIVPVICDYLREQGRKLGWEVEIMASQVNGQVFLDI